MTDLLDQLTEINPVPSCDPPSIDDVWRKLDARGDEPDTSPRHDTSTQRDGGGGLLGRGMRALPALVALAVCLVVVIVAVTGPRPAHGPSGGVGSAIRSTPAFNASDAQHPSLSALVAHFAVLRRAATAADRAARPRFAFGVGSRGQTEYPTYVRFAGDANGIPVYFAADAQRRHGATGPVVGYSMQVAAGGAGINYSAGSYAIFPTVVTTDSGRPRSEYLSIVPDGVRMVRWRLACPSNARGCVLPGRRHTVSVPVQGNLAVMALENANPGTFYAEASSVTWYRDDGTQTAFTNVNAAVPFAGAPPWPVSRSAPAQSYAPGNGPPAGESLAYWRSLYGVLRRPQDALDRSAVAKAAGADRSPIVPGLTRVVLGTHGALVFITLSAVNPEAPPPERRYVAAVWSASRMSGVPTQSVDLTPGVGLPFGTFMGARATLEYSVVPDDVAKVSWTYRCTGCGRLSGSPLTVTAHDNAVHAVISADSLSPQHATWYRRGGAKPLQFGG